MENARKPQLKRLNARSLLSWRLQIRYDISLMTERRNYWQRLDEKDKKKKREDTRIVGGCASGHTPWYVFLEITGDSSSI